ncbi:hypothetical protein JHK82_055705 [Glycine max]|nr:hypothetical protein JHK82_055705 [Glycine max]
MASTSSLSECRDTTKLPGGSLNLKFLCVSHLYFSGPEARFERLPKLVRATIAIGHVLLEDKEEADLILEFQNLTHLELGYSDYTRDWIERLEVIKRFPNLQILDIDMGSIDMNARGDEGADWPFPRSVPSCISLHLKTCEEEEETKKQRKVVLGVAITLFYGKSGVVDLECTTLDLVKLTPGIVKGHVDELFCASAKEWPTHASPILPKFLLSQSPNTKSSRLVTVCAEVKQTSTVATTTTSSDNKICEILGNHNYNKLGLPFNEQKYLANVIVDTILDNALALVLHLIQVLGLLHQGKALEQVVKLVPTQDLMLDGSGSSSYSSSCLRVVPLYVGVFVWTSISECAMQGHRFKEWGFDKGWGNIAGRVKETMKLLYEVLESADPLKLESLFSRLPNMFNIAFLSIHG